MKTSQEFPPIQESFVVEQAMLYNKIAFILTFLDESLLFQVFFNFSEITQIIKSNFSCL